MKAGAFGRQPERRPVQPGGRVLPGMFSPSPAPDATAPTTSTTRSSPASSSSTQPKVANPTGTLLSSWGTSGRASGRLPGTTAPSRLERLATEARTSEGDGIEAPSRGGTAASISRARKLGLNRRARTPSPSPSSPEYSPQPSPPRSPSPRHGAQMRARPVAQAAPSSRARDRGRSASPPSTRPSRSSSPPPVDAATALPAAASGPEQPQGLLSSIWGRATQLVGGSAAGQQPSVVREVGHNRANSVDSSLPVPPSHVTPFQLDDEGGPSGGGEREHDAHAPPARKEPSPGRNTRPIALPPLVAPARTLTTSSHPAARRISAPPGLARAASEPLPPVEPITYHRPPPLHPRTSALGAGAGAQPQRSSASSPYDWLESRDEAPLEPFLFTRALGRAATRRGGRTARRPAMPQGAMTEPGPHAGDARAVGAGAGAAALVGASAAHGPPHVRCVPFRLSSSLSLPLVDSVMSPRSIPPLAPPAFAYAPPPVHPGPPPALPLAHPGAAPPLVASAFAPTPPRPDVAPSHGLPPPPTLVAPSHAWSSAAAAPGLVAVAPPLAAARAPTSYAQSYAAAPAQMYEPHAPPEVVEPAEAAPAEPLPSYEPRGAPVDEGEAHDEFPHVRRLGAPTQASEEEALPRSGAGPDSLPIYPSPSSGISQLPPVPAPPVAATAPSSMSAAAPYSQASYSQAPYAPAAYSQGPQPSYAAASQVPPAPPLVPPAALAPTSQPYWPAPPPPPPALPQFVATSAPGPSAFTVASAPAPAPAPASAAASTGDEHYAAHFGTAGPSLSSVLPRLFAAALPAPGGSRPAPASAPQGQRATPPQPATSAASGAAASGHGDLPAGPPILPVTPPPGPPTSASAPAPHPTTQALYPTHLASVQQQQQQRATGALGQTSWRAPMPLVVPNSAVAAVQPLSAVARLPSPAAPSPAPSSLGSPSTLSALPSHAAVVEPHSLEDDDVLEEVLPGYEAPSVEAPVGTTSSSEKETLLLPPHTALATPLPPSPAPPLAVEPAPSSAVAHAAPPVPARLSSLLVDTAASSPPHPPPSSPAPASTARESSSIVLIPPTPLEPHFAPPPTASAFLLNAHPSASPSPTSPEAQPAPAPVPLPTLEPLELGFTLNDLGLGALDFVFGALDEVQVEQGETGEKEALPWPERATSPAVQFGEDEDDEDDGLSGEGPGASLLLFLLLSYLVGSSLTTSTPRSSSRRLGRPRPRRGFRRRHLVRDVLRPCRPVAREGRPWALGEDGSMARAAGCRAQAGRRAQGGRRRSCGGSGLECRRAGASPHSRA